MKKWSAIPALIFFTANLMPFLVISSRLITDQSNPICRKSDSLTFPADRVTVVINGFSEERIPLLTAISEAYSSIAWVAGVIILWCNPATSPNTLVDLAKNASADVIRAPSTSLNHRFFPWGKIKTKGVLICDDDIEPNQSSLNFAFSIWRSDPDRIVGFFVRSHAYDIDSKSWGYVMDREKYSIVLTKLMLVHIKHLQKYSCDDRYAGARLIVDEMNNCEDILMNFVASEGTEKGPVMVAAKGAGVRDHGDSRNDGGGVTGVGLSSRKAEHRQRRGNCITKFHKVLGKMPLKYSYGKVFEEVDEQGLCKKRGKFVLCDDQLLSD